MSSSWWTKRQVLKHSELFWRRLAAGETSAALELYERRLAPREADLGRPLKAAYRLHRWLARRQDEDLQALRGLVLEDPENRSIRGVWHLLLRLRRETDLARALESGSTGPPETVSGEGAAEEPAEQHHSLERLALAILEVRRLGLERADRSRIAAKVLALLPEPTGPEALSTDAVPQLVGWAACTLGRYDQIIRHRNAYRSHREILLAAAIGRGRRAVADDHMEEAQHVLAEAVEASGQETRCGLVLDWGRWALGRGDRDSRGPEHWFRSHYGSRSAEDPIWWAPVLALAFGATLLGAGRATEGRRVIGQLEAALAESAQDGEGVGTGFWSRLRPRLLGQCCFLSALALLAGVRDWALSEEEGEAEEGVESGALWVALRSRLVPLVERLAGMGPDEAWRGHLLAGLIAYVDRSLPCGQEKIALFSAAIERVDSQSARTHLRVLEGSLESRARATEEAERLIGLGRPDRLLEFHRKVLSPLGAAIPATTRAAVLMSLWAGDPDFDPLPELKQLPRDPSNQTLIDRCVVQVQIDRVLGRLADECTRLEPSGTALPSLDPLYAWERGLAEQAALAGALIQIRRGDLGAARAYLAEIGDGPNRQEADYLRFYLAWRSDDLATCNGIAHGEPPNLYVLRHGDAVGRALRTRMLLQTLEAVDPGPGRELIRRAAESAEAQGSQVVSLTVWLLEHDRPGLARALLAAWQVKDSEPDWPTLVLQTLVAARLGRYHACLESVERLRSTPVPERTVFGGAAEHRRILGWMELFGIEAELALLAESTGDLRSRWPSVRRALESRLGRLARDPATRPYGYLLSGLLASLATDEVIGDDTIEQLVRAQRTLELDRRAGFLEERIGRLTWRKTLVEEFWRGLAEGDHRKSRRIAVEELEPAFGDRLPASIRLGALLTEWESGGSSPEDLLRRLTILRHEAPELSGKLLDRAEGILRDSGQVATILELFRTKDFTALGKTIERATWSGHEPGAMPLPVALALLYSHFKSKRTAAAEGMAAHIRGMPRLPDWIRNDAGLLLGYHYYGKEEYPKAAEAFGQISESTLLEHDTDRYWAASHFAHGLQLLAVDQKAKAFDAFSRSLGQREGVEKNVNLAPLFLHFGLRNLEARNGNRARQAFSLLEKSLEGLSESAEVQRNTVLAQMGALLCRCLIEDSADEVEGADFAALADALEGAAELAEDQLRPRLERSLRLLATCQGLRRQNRLPAAERQEPEKIFEILTEQVKAIERIDSALERHDPVVLALKGSILLLLPKRARTVKAFKCFEQAMRLGLQSSEIHKLIQKHKGLKRKISETETAVLDLFDAFLLEGSIPQELKTKLKREDDVAALYRLYRDYRPDDIVVQDGASGTEDLCRRLEHLVKFARKGKLPGDEELEDRAEKIDKLVASLRRTEKKALAAEERILGTLARSVREQTPTQEKPR